MMMDGSAFLKVVAKDLKSFSVGISDTVPLWRMRLKQIHWEIFVAPYQLVLYNPDDLCQGHLPPQLFVVSVLNEKKYPREWMKCLYLCAMKRVTLIMMMRRILLVYNEFRVERKKG